MIRILLNFVLLQCVGVFGGMGTSWCGIKRLQRCQEWLVMSLLDNWNAVHAVELAHRHAVAGHGSAEEQWTKPNIGNINFNCYASIFTS